MSRLTVTVSRTAGAGPGTGHGDQAGRMSGWALGRGVLADALDQDYAQLGALVLMPEPALPGANVSARPIGVLHLAIDGVEHDEVVCARPGDPADRILGDLSTPRTNEPLCEAVRRLHPGQACTILAGGRADDAESIVEQAFQEYCRTSGSLD
jgi:inorganic pyrophosphatase